MRSFGSNCFPYKNGRAYNRRGLGHSRYHKLDKGYDHCIKFWEALSGACIRTLQHPDSINRLAISPDKRILAAAGNPLIRLYDIQSSNPNPISTFEGHTKNVTAIAFQSAGRWFVTGSEDGTIKIYDVRIPGIQRDYTPDPKSPVNDVIIHPNQGELISCDQNGSIRVWDLGENSCTHELLPDEDTPVRSVSMASDGSLLVAANNKGILPVLMQEIITLGRQKLWETRRILNP